jgi:hypothetical protein
MPTILWEREGHPKIRISVADGCSLSTDWLWDYFDAEIRNGKQFRAGETVQIGWMIIQLQEVSTETLELWEPDFDAMPIKWCLGVTNTLRHLLIQRAVCDEMGCDLAFPSLLEAGIAGVGFLNSGSDFEMSREEPTGADSGWLFRPSDTSTHEAEYKSLYEIALHCPFVIPFLALPPGSSVKKVGGALEVANGATQLTSGQNDFLRQISETSVFV